MGKTNVFEENGKVKGLNIESDCVGGVYGDCCWHPNSINCNNKSESFYLYSSLFFCEYLFLGYKTRMGESENLTHVSYSKQKERGREIIKCLVVKFFCREKLK